MKSQGVWDKHRASAFYGCYLEPHQVPPKATLKATASYSGLQCNEPTRLPPRLSSRQQLIKGVSLVISVSFLRSAEASLLHRAGSEIRLPQVVMPRSCLWGLQIPTAWRSVSTTGGDLRVTNVRSSLSIDMTVPGPGGLGVLPEPAVPDGCERTRQAEQRATTSILSPLNHGSWS